MPAIGVLLGLALASKWVAAYAIGALGILVLVRIGARPDHPDRRAGRRHRRPGLDGAGRAPDGSGGTGNLPFSLIMIALTLAAVVVTVYHPVEWSDDEMRFAVGGAGRRWAS